MAGELVLPRAPALPASVKLAELAFVALLFLIFVGLTPFADRDQVAIAATNGAGDAARQAAFASVFGLIVFTSLRLKGWAAFETLSPLLGLLLLWCLASAWWSVSPDVTFRRAMLATVVVFSALMSFATLGEERSFRLLQIVLAGILIVNWCSIPVLQQAVHLAGDPEPQLAGDWRGLYFHKNIAGAVSAITAILFFFSAWDRRRWIDAVLCIAAIGFTIMTRSKSSLLLLPVALAAGAIYRLTWRRPLDRLIVSVVFALGALAAVAFVLLDQSAIGHLFADPEGFTGRTEIWKAELAYIGDHPYLGAGFGSFSDTGSQSALHDYIASSWINAASHGHNAYLQICVTIGGIGLVLALLALVFSPLVAFCGENGARVAKLAMPFALFVFLVLHNLLETDFLEGDAAAWVTFLFVLATLRLEGRSAS
jgi:O-antigen ligase